MMRRGIGRRGRPGLVGTMARTAVVAGTATAVVGGMSRRQQGKAQQAADAQAYEQQQQQAQIDAQVAAAVAAQAPPPAAPAAPAAAAEDDKIAQLTKLGELKAQGILTEEEFAAQKANCSALTRFLGDACGGAVSPSQAELARRAGARGLRPHEASEAGRPAKPARPAAGGLRQEPLPPDTPRRRHGWSLAGWAASQ